MPALETATLATRFAQARWGRRFRDRAALERWQAARIERFLRTTVRDAAFYRERPTDTLAALPIVDKASMLERFADFNTRGIKLDEALAAARAAEAGRPAPAGFDASLAAGLSSGTTGPPAVFLASGRERAAWAGTLLARTLHGPLLRDVLARRAPLRIAFFLRADSALYRTLASGRIALRFFDLMRGVAAHAAEVTALEPEVVVAPASVLAWLADETRHGRLRLGPRHVVSVAEVLEPDDATAIAAAFGVVPHQIYQATEGFLGATCAHGVMHLNEDVLHVEPEWIDATRTRFVPIVTDFTRRTQMIVRYRLDDVLRVRDAPCACGSVMRTIEAIEGRADDVLWLRAADGEDLRPLFPDTVRHAIARDADGVGDYRIEQHDDVLHLWTAEPAARASTTKAIDACVVALGMTPPSWRPMEQPVVVPGRKRRRIACVRRPVSRA